jgi:predicted small lipoprotein YifL
MSGLKRRLGPISILGLAAVFVILGMAGCGSIGSLKLPGAGAAAPGRSDKGWWYASFKINWPQDEDLALDTDLLIAHRIISPVLDRYKKDIPLWRFHRRAVRDDAGHRFSFIFYTSAATARKIYAAIDSSAVLKLMRAEGVITKVLFDDINSNQRPCIESASDPGWSVPIQKAWPYFIMGVSQTWLDLISQYAEDGRRKPLSPAEMRAFYREINQEVESTWKNEGGHAFLHHLNALFGYGPVNLRGKIEMNF